MMKSIVSIELALLSLILMATCSPAKPSAQSKLGVFVGTSPCDSVARRPLGIPATADCEMIKWNLTLHQEPGTLAPTTYEFNFTYGMAQPNTTGFKNGGTKAERKGKWSIGQGTRTDSGLLVYKLDAARSEESISFVKLDENLLAPPGHGPKSGSRACGLELHSVPGRKSATTDRSTECCRHVAGSDNLDYQLVIIRNNCFVRSWTFCRTKSLRRSCERNEPDGRS